MSRDRRHTVLAATASILVVTSAAVFPRIWLRVQRRDFGFDDGLVCFSWACLVGFMSAVILATHHGLGLDIGEVSTPDKSKFLMLNVVFSCTFSWAIATAKMSFAVLYMRLLPKTHLLILNKCLIGFLFCQALEETMIAIFMCVPVGSAWTPGMKGKCIDIRVLWWKTFAFNLSTDLILFIQPIPTVWKLQMPKGKRIGVIFMMSLGLLVCIISIVRIIQTTSTGSNTTQRVVDGAIWCETEISALLICSSIPTLKVLVQKIPGFYYVFNSITERSNPSKLYMNRGQENSRSIPLSGLAERKHAKSKGMSQIIDEVSDEATMSREAFPHARTIDSTEEIFPHKTSTDEETGRRKYGSRTVSLTGSEEQSKHLKAEEMGL
ncbi:unnamed protein product [Clonostachys rosea f. rosea IK726]|uniref:Uncharacterized protein n=1 Tax=Clonostachys rosea f. rosea IK726 TaxID=1349383 RepID=A0ACA9U751_BIOOC|nr:unnamed protein product [Clonostachys rosea f. rosea IK726]